MDTIIISVLGTSALCYIAKPFISKKSTKNDKRVGVLLRRAIKSSIFMIGLGVAVSIVREN